MTTARIISVVSYALTALFMVIVGMLYPQVHEWSYWAAYTCGIHGALTVLVASVNLVAAARVAAASWLALSNIICIALLLTYTLTAQGGWLLVAVAFGMFTLLAILLIVLMLKSGSTARPAPSKDGETHTV